MLRELDTDLWVAERPQRFFGLEVGTRMSAAVDVVRTKAQRGEVEIRRDVPADLPPLYADPDRVEQVLVNLLDNAVKYTPAGGRVTVAHASV